MPKILQQAINNHTGVSPKVVAIFYRFHPQLTDPRGTDYVQLNPHDSEAVRRALAYLKGDLARSGLYA